ncbi:hypothetical protein [Georgenia yuyongxinii]|uniref:EcsC family protein n=1 Tax=Georgenia yuyongxinii TaxID=2589797 RepID=A0A552WKV7_9MICO|nr:hypothetical protein [Georgenia yuyongxinii]TRW43388.1 hypothetical protein FJ693_17800 [Georgenia yuyongxinii]
MSRGTPVLDLVLDRAVQRSKGHEVATKLRQERPGASPAELVAVLESRYVRNAGLLGGGVGAVATVPAVGTGTAAVLTTAQVAASMTSAATFVMAVASLHGVRVDDLERRRTLLMGALLGEDGAEAVSGQMGLGTLYWAKAALTKLPINTIRTLNRRLRRRLLRAGAVKGGSVVLGRLAPFGVGAVIGYFGTRAVAKNVVEGVEKAFGPAPATFADAHTFAAVRT